MQIAAIPSIGPTAPAFHPVLVSRSPSAVPTARVEAPSAPVTRVEVPRQPPAQAPAPNSSGPVDPSYTGYSTTVAGVLYSGSVEVDGGDYTAVVPYLAGAVANGLSLESAEDNLNSRISILV